MSLILITLILSTLTQVILSVNLPIVINTWAFIDAANEAWKVLHQPYKTPLDALVEGCSTCERLQCDGTVGYGGSPDERGETTLDAMVMDGGTMNIGAVAALRNIKHAIRVARHVLEYTQHTLLVGDQASEFAQMMGFQKESLSTSTSKNIWSKWWTAGCQPNFWIYVKPDPKSSCGPYKPEANYRPLNLERDNEKFGFGYKNHDTIGMIVIDSTGHIYAGTSTNGASHKIPGRVGDSPIPGAGAYADNEFGAAAATGDGDVMMRFLPSFVAVENLRAGQDPTTAAKNALNRILKYHSKFMGGLIVVNRFGEFGAACTGIEKFPFSVAFGNQTKAKIEYIDYLSWLPHKKSLIDIYRVAFGNAEYVSIRKSLQNNFQPKIMSMETEGLEGVFNDKDSPRMIEAIELDDQNCFVANKEANKSLSVFCVEHGDKGLKFVHKNDIQREGVMQIVSLEKNLIVILLNDSVEIWKPNEPEKCKQKIPAVTPSQISAVVTGDSVKFIAICSKIKPKSFHHGLVDIYRSTGDNDPFQLIQTIEVVSPLQVEFLLIPQSGDILLTILTESFNEPLAIYQYKGVVGFQSIVSSSTLTPGTSISVIHLKASQQHLLAMMSKDELTFVEAVLHKT